MYFDSQEVVRFRIESERWTDQSPLGPNEEKENREKISPYVIEGSMAEDGLGPVLWWD
jgi:DNA-directed RNA polymerase subunit E'/Rpb7